MVRFLGSNINPNYRTEVLILIPDIDRADCIAMRDAVKTFKEKPNPTRLLEQYEIARLLEATPDRLKGLIACAVYAGLRLSELLHLRWKDIDWNARELHVVSRREHHTKNYESRRIPMNDALVEALQRHPRHIKSPYVFCNRNGQPLKNLRTALNYAAKRAGIEDAVKMHQLRHAFCSHAMMQGIDPSYQYRPS